MRINVKLRKVWAGYFRRLVFEWTEKARKLEAGLPRNKPIDPKALTYRACAIDLTRMLEASMLADLVAQRAKVQKELKRLKRRVPG